MGGLIVGIFWGALVSGIVLAAVSLSSPLPPRPGAPAPEAAAEVAAEIEAPVSPETPASEPELPVADTESASDAEPAPEAETAPGAEPTPEVETEAVREPEAQPAASPETTPEAEPAATPEASAPATEVPLPAGSEFNRPPTEEAAVLPAADAAPNAATPGAPQLAAPAPAPLADTAPLAQPDVTETLPPVAAVAPVLDVPEAPELDASAPTRSTPSTLEAETPDAAPTVEVRSVAPPTLPQAPLDDDEASVERTPEPEPETEEVAVIVAPRLPSIGDAEEEAAEQPQSPTFPTTESLPTVAPLAGGDTTPEPEGVDVTDSRAITTFAAPFDMAEPRPLLSIVLIDDPDSRLDIETLTRFTFPVTFAIDPLHPEAADRAAAYRAAGFEVAILAAMLPDGADATDVEAAFGAALTTLPEAVAVVDTPDGRVQSDRPILDATVAALADSGHGLLAFPLGLNAAEQSARRENVPGATLFRLLDDEDQRATEITRYLARAALTAAQEGVVIVAGRTRPDTVTALFSWALGERSSAVALAPLSAALLRSSEE